MEIIGVIFAIFLLLFIVGLFLTPPILIFLGVRAFKRLRAEVQELKTQLTVTAKSNDTPQVQSLTMPTVSADIDTLEKGGVAA
jgi:uncharacterized membrane protein (DUF106 family)